MQKFTRHTGLVLPVDRSNVDTDAILPKEYLKSISKTGFADWLFDDLRYLDPGDVETETVSRRINPDFVLNKPEYQGASVLIARENFGCGSSREQAVWALRDYGVRALIAPSFADIFHNNCFKNGVLPIVLSADDVEQLFRLCYTEASFELTVDLEAGEVSQGDIRKWSFTTDPARRQRLLLGQDDIALTLEYAASIRQFENGLREREPWLFGAAGDEKT